MKNRFKILLYIGFVSALIISILIGINSYTSFKKQVQISGLVEHSYMIMNVTQDIQKLMVDMETGQRGFRSTSDTQFLQPYEQARQAIDYKITELSGLESDNLLQENKIAILKKNIEQLLQFWEHSRLDTVKNSRELISEITDVEKKQMDEIRNNIYELLRVENALLEQKEKVSNNIIEFTSRSSIAGSILIEAIILILIVLIIREFNNSGAVNKKLLHINEELNNNKTELVKISETLLKNETRLKQAQTIAHVGSWEYDVITHTAIWSDEACRIYGLPIEENKQSFKAWRSFIYPDDIDFVMKSISRANKTLSNMAFQYRIIQKNGTIKYIYFQGVHDTGTDGKAKTIYGVVHDITEVKLLELETLQLIKNLQKKNEDLKLSAYMLSHNLRSSIAKILGLVNLIKEEPGNNKTNMNLIDYIKNEATGLDSIVKDINAVITAGGLD